MGAESRLKELGIILPQPPAAVANYVPFVRTGSLLVISGQLALGPDGKLAPAHKGKLGQNVSIEAGQEAARLCGLNILAQAKAALGSLDHVAHCVKLGGFVNCAPGFDAIPAIINGASNLMADIFGERGKHARFAVGACELPLDSAVEIEAMFEIA